MRETDVAPSEQARYWNEDGGRRWLANMDALETILARLGQRLLQQVAARPGERVLDIGCGGGNTSAALAAAVGSHGSVLGVDISAPILAAARERHAGIANLRFLEADAGSDALPVAAFDVLTSRFGVMFFHDPLGAFTHLRQAAAPGARLVFMCWRRFDENPWMGVPAAAVFSVLPAPPRPAPGTPGPFAFADADRLRTLLEAAGFTAVRFTPVDQSLNLGPLEDALERMTQIGPAAQPLREAEPAARAQALAAMRSILATHCTDAGVMLAGATWLVEAELA